jgi:peptidoglycan hydrolase-like protein with peptidoglycan-binding domain
MAIDHFPPPGPFPAEKAIWVETILNVCEGEKLKIDGFFEPAPWAAIKSFQQRNSLPVTGGFDNRTLVALTQRALNVIQGSVLPIGGGVMAELAVAVI